MSMSGLGAGAMRRSVALELCERLLYFLNAEAVELAEALKGEVHQLACGGVIFRAGGEEGLGDGEEGGGWDAAGRVKREIDAKEFGDTGGDEGGFLVSGTAQDECLVKELGETDDGIHLGK